MRVDAKAATPGDTSSGAATGIGDQSGMFMKLLMAQLQNQDPLAPTDANSFVEQMVQFNTLDQITQIRQLVQALATAPAS
jgi:flagellar basal-body rod modification protein FlgD